MAIFYWTKLADDSERRVSYGGPIEPPALPVIIRSAIASENVVQVFGPYTKEEVPASLAACTNDKKLKG